MFIPPLLQLCFRKKTLKSHPIFLYLKHVLSELVILTSAEPELF